MEILIDGKHRDMSPLPDTMGKLISELRSAVANAGRIILDVEVDGSVIEEEDERRIAADPIDEHATVAVRTTEPRTLCLSTLQEVSGHIPPIVEECSRIAGLIDAGKEMDAFKRIVPCIEVWGAILSAIQKISILMKLDISEVSTDKEALTESINALVTVLQSIKTAIGAHDTVSVRDSMKYEMPEVAERISKQIIALSAAIAARQA